MSPIELSWTAKKVKVSDCSTGSVLEIDRDGYHGRGTKDIIRGQKRIFGCCRGAKTDVKE